MTENSKPSWDQLRDEAADWLAGMDTGMANRDDFEAWRDSDPRHAAAFAQVAHSMMTVDRVKPALKENPPQSSSPSRRRLFVAAAALAVTAVGASFFTMSQAKASVQTAIGERRDVLLPGGGTMQVNTDSKVQWHAADHAIEVWLLKGEVALNFAESYRKCILRSADRVAEFSDAIINARLRGNLLDLAVVSGNCALKSTASEKSINTTEIQANHAVLVSAEQSVVRPLDAMDTAVLEAWPRDELVFQGQTLDTAVAEYNRYLTRKIVIADGSLSGLKLGGRFATRDPNGFLRALHGSFGIRVVDDGSGDIALTK